MHQIMSLISYSLHYYPLCSKGYMFSGASSFDQNLCRWDKDLTSYIAFCSGASCGTCQQPTPAPSPNAARTTFITGIVALFSIIAFEII